MKANKLNLIIIILSFIIAAIAINIFASRHPIRLDFTRNNIYTLSESTKEILNNLKDVVTIRLYFTDQMPPALAAHQRQVEDIISEYKSAAKNYVQIEHIDPGVSPVEEQKAMLLGIPPIQVNVIEKDKQELAKIYMGIAIFHSDKKVVLPVVQRIDNFEYELTQSILKVSSESIPKIAWLQVENENQTYNNAYRSTLERMDIEKLQPDNIKKLSPDEIRAMVILGASELDEKAKREIDDYLTGGGNILFFAGRWDVENNMQKKKVESDIFDLISNYGITVNDDLVVDQSNAMASFSGGAITYHLPYPFWPQVQAENFSQNFVAVSQLQSLVLPWTSSLSVKLEDDMKEIVLATTTKYGVAIDGNSADLNPQMINNQTYGQRDSTIELASNLTGPFKSAFVGSIDKTSVPGRLIAVGNSNFISDTFTGQFPENMVFFENILDSVAFGDKLIGIRSRVKTSRPIAPLPEGAPQLIRWTNMLLMPIATLLLGAAIYLLRRHRNKKLALEYNG
ncbi:MAG: GldG family protein [Pseudomonadota bacterium]